jgi:hypothetical protein
MKKHLYTDAPVWSPYKKPPEFFLHFFRAVFDDP